MYIKRVGGKKKLRRKDTLIFWGSKEKRTAGQKTWHYLLCRYPFCGNNN